MCVSQHIVHAFHYNNFYWIEFPSAPQNLKYSSVVEDLRPGFVGHAVVTLEWDRPEDGKRLILLIITL